MATLIDYQGKHVGIEPEDVQCIRGTGSGSAVYMKDGNTYWFNEDFETIDNIINN